MVFGIIGFIFLDLYFNLVPVKLSNSYLQLATILLFFPLAQIVGKIVGINGLAGMGIHFHKGWFQNFIISFFIGFTFWAIWDSYYFLIGDYQFQGLNPSFLGMPLMEVVVGYFLGSLINDIMIRGYLIALLLRTLNIKWVLVISVLIYALEDFWYAGFSVSNIIFSIILGMSLTYAFYKTGSIWANTGIHFGSNMLYGLMSGQLGKANSSLFIINKVGKDTIFSQIVDYGIPTLMFLFLLWAIRFYNKSGQVKGPSPSITLNQ